MKVKFYPGENKLETIKFVKEFFNFSLTEAKDAYDSREVDVAESEINTFNERLKKLGGFVINFAKPVLESQNLNEHFQMKIGDVCHIGVLSFTITEIHTKIENDAITLNYRGKLI